MKCLNNSKVKNYENVVLGNRIYYEDRNNIGKCGKELNLFSCDLHRLLPYWTKEPELSYSQIHSTLTYK